MKKLNEFVVASVVNNLMDMSNDDLQKVAILLANDSNGAKWRPLLNLLFKIFKT